MAIEYTFYSAADLSTDRLRSMIAAVIAGTIMPDGSLTREGLWTTAHRVEPGDEATAPPLFGFTHRLSVRFRFSATRRDLEEHNTALMVGAVLALAQADGVLLFNGEEAVLQCVNGEATFAADWDGWDDMPEVAALQAGRRTAHLAQPLL
ncbi:SitI3 family protein [Paractinoplanes durhamensis]|uniref:Uncharacterized protein n=1 Tax=Paractinoplanes durhamensis TaxID=113563 RepID=A0ABQ3ZBH7_9ACTN|nr:SitI3 family protein [Actinoplanes durhamensis]GIE07180.1 hypothetical protein Adu01nite_85300 [Actinoplanes durhamensis]